jgi:Zn-finger nucleic acid-binding protein
VKSRHCPFCGGENKKEILHESPACPRCHETLRHFESRGTVLDNCPSCEGLWLDTQEFDQLTSERNVYADTSIPYEYQRQALPDEKAYLCCPLCGSMMIRKNFRKISGVLIDQCRDHGIWLDAGELDQIRCFIANGGLDKSQDREILKNKEEIDFVAHKVKNIEYLQKKLNFWNFKYWLFRI